MKLWEEERVGTRTHMATDHFFGILLCGTAFLDLLKSFRESLLPAWTLTKELEREMYCRA